VNPLLTGGSRSVPTRSIGSGCIRHCHLMPAHDGQPVSRRSLDVVPGAVSPTVRGTPDSATA
jgi:hypothetical protein